MKRKLYGIIAVAITMLFLTELLNAQTVSNVFLTGNYSVGSTLTGNYTTSGITDQVIELEWFSISPRTSIATAASTYTLLSAQQGKKVYFRVVIKDNTGTTVLDKDSTAYSLNIEANKAPVASSVSTLGNIWSGHTVFATYSYSDFEGDLQGTSTFRWTVSDDNTGDNETDITGATSQSYLIPDSYIGKYLKFYVTPVAQSGTLTGTEVTHSGYIGPVVNNAPAATAVSISGSKNVNGVMIGNYTYSDSEGDAQSGTTFRWLSANSETGTYNTITGATSQAYSIKMSEQGKWFKFEVRPRAATGTLQGSWVSSLAFGPANSKPVASSVSITGTTTRNSTLTGHYTVTDPDLDPEGSHIFKWYRDGVEISGADQDTYTLKLADVGSNIKFEITPVSSAGYPDTGDPVKSSQVGPVTDPSGTPPEALDVCISGRRELNYELTGNYYYQSSSYPEGSSVYLWFRNGTRISGANTKKYKLTTSDIGAQIKFGVIPYNSQGTKNDTVFSAPLAIFTLSQSDYSIVDTAIVLTASPSGGVFSGPGVVNGKFSPSIAGFVNSPHTLEYLLNIENANTTCIQRAFKEVNVTDVKLTLEGVDPYYCNYTVADTIRARNLPKVYFSPKFRITNYSGIIKMVNDSVMVFDPSKLPPGTNVDTIVFTVSDGIRSLPSRKTVIIEAVPEVKFTKPDDFTFVCSGQSPFKIFVTPEGNNFQGPVSGGNFIPSAWIGDTSVIYTYTTSRGCVRSDTMKVTVHQSVSLQFSTTDNCIANSSDSIVFKNESDPKGIVSKWEWTFYDLGSSFGSQKLEPSFLFRSGSLHDVILQATTNEGCVSKLTKSFDLGVVPNGDFYWRRDCYAPGDYLELRDTSTSFSQIVSRTWDLHAGDSLRTTKVVKFPKSGPATLDVEYIVRTGYLNCHDTVRKTVYIKPTLPVTADGLFEDFEDGKSGWELESFTDKWEFGTPNRSVINSAGSGTKAWFTNYLLTDQSKAASYSVTSPCYDLTALQKPIISLNLWKRFDRNLDGAALQYRIGDDLNWEYIGTLDDGINWYNSTLIKGRPGGDQVGWTAGAPNVKDDGWRFARHTLDGLAGKKDVKFRIVYATNGSASDNDGIAFDDIFISERTRVVLLEHFLNISNKQSDEATMKVSDYANRKTGDVVNIQYHTNFPGEDGYYSDNPADAASRILYYGLLRVPYSMTDGGTRTEEYAYAFNHYPVAFLDTTSIILRSLVYPPFEITLNADANSGPLKVSGSVKSLVNFSASNLTLYIAVTEKKSTQYTGNSDITEFSNVFRKFLPNAAGINLDKTWTSNTTKQIDEISWVIEKIKNGANVEVIAFLQNNITKEIYQTESVSLNAIVVGIDDEPESPVEEYSIYPNPSNGRFVIDFGTRTEKELSVIVYNMAGKPLRTYKAAAGTDELVVEDSALSDGIYLVGIGSGYSPWKYKKLVVNRK